MDLAGFCNLQKKLLKMYLDNCPFLFKFALEYAFRRVLLSRGGLQLNGTYHTRVYAAYVNVLVESLHTTKEAQNF
jgi:hypothetical protein